jgi:hypothetical protein
MNKMIGTIITEPKPDNGRVDFFMNDVNDKEMWCISGPGFQCPRLLKGMTVSLVGDRPRDLFSGGDSPYFSFYSVKFIAA